jgi:hypothetical protein
MDQVRLDRTLPLTGPCDCENPSGARHHLGWESTAEDFINWVLAQKIVCFDTDTPIIPHIGADDES